MPRYAVVKDGVVQNTIEYDGESPIDFGEGAQLIAVPDGEPVSEGWSFSGGSFSAPTPPAPVTEIRFHTNSKLVNDEVVITEDTDWQLLGGVVTNASFFLPDLSKGVGRVVGAAKTQGTGAQLRLVEDDGTQEVKGTYNLPDTEDAWEAAKFSTTVPPRAGDQTYRLEGRLNGATSASVRFVSVSLLEVVIK